MGGVIAGVDTTVDMFATAVLMEDSVIHNRHGIDYYTVYPFELTLPGKPGYKTALNTFQNRFYKEIRWGLQHDMLPAALLQLPDETRNIIADYLDISPSKNGGFTKYGDLFSVSQGLNLMLLQSHDGIIELFPACPKNWNASFKLRAEGSVLVEAKREKDKPVTCSILSLKGGKISVKNSLNAGVDVYDGNNLVFSTTDEIISWRAEKGKPYSLVLKGEKPTNTVLSTPRERNNSVKRFRKSQFGL
jgi:hypothetical protein